MDNGNVGVGVTAFAAGTRFGVVGGNVGIGTSSASSVLSVIGNGLFGADWGGKVAPVNGLAIQGSLGIGTSTANSLLSVAGNAHIGSLYQSIVAPNNGMFVDGNLGIGATTSNNKLDVWGNVSIGGSLNIQSTVTLPQYNCAGFNNGGKLTIGSAGAIQCADDAGSASSLSGTGSANSIAFWTNGTTLSNDSTDFAWDSTNNFLSIGDHTSVPTETTAGQLALGSTTLGGAGGRIWAFSNGRQFRFQSVANSADYSEYLQQEDTSEPGDVMVLSDTGFESVKRSTSSYDQNVLGVVTKYGTSNNQGACADEVSCNRGNDPKWANVGMLGQVYTKVSTENGNIKPGDPLTTSNAQGVAMKATKAGRIVGYALDTFDGTKSGMDLWDHPPTDADQPKDITVTLPGQSPKVVRQGKILILLQASWFDPDAPPLLIYQIYP